MSFDAPEILRRLGDLIRKAKVASVADRTCMVTLSDDGDPLGPFEWLVGHAGATASWSKPSKGEQVILFCQEGDVEHGFVMRGTFSGAFPPPTTDDVEMIRFRDGAVMKYDPTAHALTCVLPEGGTFELTAPGGATITADLTLQGDLSQTGDAAISGKVTANDDVVGGGKSLKGHKHTGVEPGGGVSGGPQ
jgi:phage baseplate assembly protein V